MKSFAICALIAVVQAVEVESYGYGAPAYGSGYGAPAQRGYGSGYGSGYGAPAQRGYGSGYGAQRGYGGYAKVDYVPHTRVVQQAASASQASKKAGQ